MKNNDTQSPIATIFAGVNGAGKTTLYYNEWESKKDFGFRINIDEIVTSFGDWRSAKDQMRASKIALIMRNRYMNKLASFNQESTLCGSSIIALFHRLKSLNYSINLYYVGVDSVDIAKERVKIRVQKGGHDIAPHIIEKRYYQSLKNLAKIINLCNKVAVFDNSIQYTKILEITDNKPKIIEHTKFSEIINPYLNLDNQKHYSLSTQTNNPHKSPIKKATKQSKSKSKGLER